MSASAPAPRKRRKKVDYYKWAAGIGVPILVAAIGLLKGGGGESKTSGNFTYVGNISIIENQYQQATGHPLGEAEKAQIAGGINLARNGEYEAGRKILEQVMAKVPVAALLNTVGSFYAEKGDMQTAHRLFDEALAKDGSYKPAVENLARLKSAPLQGGEKALAGGRESEPNNDNQHANILPVGMTVTGELPDAQDTDFFRITTGPAPRDIYRITLTTATTLRPDFVVFDPQKNVMFEDRRETPGAEIVREFSPLAAANYYVQVAPWGTSGTYTLMVQPLHRFDGFEPNDDIGSAKPMPLGRAIEANIMDPSDVDFYQVKAGATSLTVSLTTSTTLRPDFVVFDAERNQMFEDRRETPGAIVERKFDTQPNKIYYIEVTPWGTSGSYTLKVQ